ncbi:hypothetical protein J1614_006033 [Plenodomus biglobosus]|nr:hypothetical protein J1614_006033 [Plenodomus biglobosus]
MPPRKRFRFPSPQGEEGHGCSSWLDLFHNHNHTHSQPPSHPLNHTNTIPPSPSPPASPTKTSRLNALRTTLADIKDSIDIRTFEHNLILTHGLFCRSCSRTAKPGSCGPSCALLHRPRSSLEPWFSHAWWQQCKADEALYYATLRAVEAAGDKPHSSQIKRWEEATERLRRGVMNEADRADAGSRRGAKVVNRDGLLKRDWSFERAWGKGSAVCDGEEVMPGEVGEVGGEECLGVGESVVT